MDQNVGIQDDKEQIEAEAAEWVIRLGDERVSLHDRVLFDQWCAQSERNRKAYDFAAKTWGDLAGLQSAKSILMPDAFSIDATPPYRAVRSSASRHFLRSGVIVGLLTICLVMSAFVATLWYGNLATTLTADYQTAPGETRTITLADGTKVDLASGSAIALAFNDKERRVKLLEGAVYFTAAPKNAQETRPFVVEGDTGTATALGTQFAVNKLSDAVEVTVVEHDVRVTLGDTDSTGGVTLSPGQKIRYSDKTGLGAVHNTSTDMTAAWRRGRLIFDNVPLADVVAELNRYRHGRIIISNNALAQRQVSGVFSTDDLGDSLAVIVRELGARSASVPPLITIIY
jgi:transmembrane sensor